jgi:CRP-like cAMP-binding protein
MGLTMKIEALEKPHAKMKLLYTIRYLCMLYGTNRWNGFVKIEVPLTQQVLADMTGLTRETTNMEINSFRKQKIITSFQKYYTVDTTKINENIDNDYESEKSLNMLPKKS